MPQQDDNIQDSLAPPGAGLPVLQAFALRHLIFPAYFLTTSWDKALAAFQAEGQKLIALAETLSANQLQQRVLIKAPMGIEDSSRYWSAAMVLEHLIEVGSRVAVGVVELTNGSTVTVKADIADVKPEGGKGREIVEDFQQFLDDYARMVTEDIGDRKEQVSASTSLVWRTQCASVGLPRCRPPVDSSQADGTDCCSVGTNLNCTGSQSWRAGLTVDCLSQLGYLAFRQSDLLGRIASGGRRSCSEQLFLY